jgi:hypothetical protein
MGVSPMSLSVKEKGIAGTAMPERDAGHHQSRPTKPAGESLDHEWPITPVAKHGRIRLDEIYELTRIDRWF